MNIEFKTKIDELYSLELNELELKLDEFINNAKLLKSKIEYYSLENKDSSINKDTLTIVDTNIELAKNTREKVFVKDIIESKKNGNIDYIHIGSNWNTGTTMIDHTANIMKALCSKLGN